MHVHRFWWAWILWFQRYRCFQKWPNFTFGPWTIVHGIQKLNELKLVQKLSGCQMHADQFWLAWPFRFWK